MNLRTGLLLIMFLFSSDAFSGDSYIDTTRIDYSRPSASTQLELITCFTTGDCKQDDKIRIYPMPCEGSGDKDCTGCYRLQGGTPIRVGDLNPNGTCAGVGDAKEQKLRVFVGYERSCPAGTAVGDSCTDGQLLLSCSVSSEGDEGASQLSYNQECFAGRPYVRRAKAVDGLATVVPSIGVAGPVGCAPGTTGTYPSCVPCSDTSYKATAGNTACAECVPPSITNSENVISSTEGTTKTSVNDCRVSFTCLYPYVLNRVNRTCDAPSAIERVASPTPSPTPTPTISPTPSPTPVPPECMALDFKPSIVSGTVIHYPLRDTMYMRERWNPTVGVGNYFSANVLCVPRSNCPGYWNTWGQSLNDVEPTTGGHWFTNGGVSMFLPASDWLIGLAPGKYEVRYIVSIAGVLCPVPSIPITVEAVPGGELLKPYLPMPSEPL